MARCKQYVAAVFVVLDKDDIPIAKGTAKELSEELHISLGAVYCGIHRTKNGVSNFRKYYKIGEKVVD